MRAVEMARKGEVQMLMKGSLHTDVLRAPSSRAREACARGGASAMCSLSMFRPITSPFS